MIKNWLIFTGIFIEMGVIKIEYELNKINVFTKSDEEPMATGLSTVMPKTCSNFSSPLKLDIFSVCIFAMLSILVGVFALQVSVCSYKKLALFTTNVHTKNECLINQKTVIRSTEPPISCRCCYSWRSCLSLVTTIFMSSVAIICRVLFCLACVSGVLFFFEVCKNILKFFLGGKGRSSFAIFGLCVGLCELQMCLHLCDG